MYATCRALAAVRIKRRHDGIKADTGEIGYFAGRYSLRGTQRARSPQMHEGGLNGEAGCERCAPLIPTAIMLPQRLRNTLDARSRSPGRSRSWAVREAIKLWLEVQGTRAGRA